MYALRCYNHGVSTSREALPRTVLPVQLEYIPAYCMYALRCYNHGVSTSREALPRTVLPVQLEYT